LEKPIPKKPKGLPDWKLVENIICKQYGFKESGSDIAIMDCHKILPGGQILFLEVKSQSVGSLKAPRKKVSYPKETTTLHIYASIFQINYLKNPKKGMKKTHEGYVVKYNKINKNFILKIYKLNFTKYEGPIYQERQERDF
jgi:hypothetical protein